MHGVFVVVVSGAVTFVVFVLVSVCMCNNYMYLYNYMQECTLV